MNGEDRLFREKPGENDDLDSVGPAKYGEHPCDEPHQTWDLPEIQRWSQASRRWARRQRVRVNTFRAVIKGGDLATAKKALEAVGAYNGHLTITEFVNSPNDHGTALLHISFDAENEEDVEGLFMVAPTPSESELISVTAADTD